MKIFVTNKKKNESLIPRNAKSIRAFKNGEPILLNKDENGYWRDEEGHIYDRSYIIQFSDNVEVVETDPNYKPKRTKSVQVLQGNYGYGWDDLIEYDKDTPYSEIRADYKSYRENEPTAQHRIITRRVPVEESVKTNESLGADITDYQRWVDYDMKHYKRISDKTMKAIKEAGLSVVKDQYGDYEVIADAKVESVEQNGYTKDQLLDVIKSYKKQIERSGKEYPTVVLDDISKSIDYVLKKNGIDESCVTESCGKKIKEDLSYGDLVEIKDKWEVYKKKAKDNSADTAMAFIEEVYGDCDDDEKNEIFSYIGAIEEDPIGESCKTKPCKKTERKSVKENQNNDSDDISADEI